MAENNVTKNVIRIDDGLRKVSIENMAGQEVGVFYFRPTDVGIIGRYDKLIGQFDEILKPLEDANLNRAGEAADPADEATSKAIAVATDKLNALLDELFDGNFSEAFFGKINPVSPVGGRFYCEAAIEMVGAYIEQEFGAEAVKMNDHISKYTNQFEGKK